MENTVLLNALEALKQQTKITLAQKAIVRKSDRIQTESHEWRDTADKWLISIPVPASYEVIRIEYWTGIGHRKVPFNNKFVYENTMGKRYDLFSDGVPKAPSLESVLGSMCMDNVYDYSFDEWCKCYGYDTDSRKALQMYLDCQESYTRYLRILRLYNIDKEALQEYLESEGLI